MRDLLQTHTLHWCRRCLGHFSNENTLEGHKRYCQRVEDIGQIFILPDPSFKIYFKNEPYVISFSIKSHSLP